MKDLNAVHRKMVYIASPYAGDIEINVERAKRYSRFAAMNGVIPIAPHLLFPQFLDEACADERNIGLYCGLALLDKCSEVWVFGNRISTGMAAEIERARYRNLTIRYFNTNCEEVLV